MFGRFTRSAKRVVNSNLMEAIVGGCLLVAAADGEIKKAELEKLDKLLTSNDNLSGFKPMEIRKVLARFQTSLEADFGVGQQKILKELSDISDNSEHCEEVFLNMLAVAKADGTVDEPELTVLLKVARSLGLSPDEFGLKAA